MSDDEKIQEVLDRLDRVEICHWPTGSDTICGLPKNSPVHDMNQVTPGHWFISEDAVERIRKSWTR